MSDQDQIQNALVMLIEGFEEFQKALEVKHIGMEVDEDTDIEKLDAEKLEQMDHEFNQAMLMTFEKLQEENNIDMHDVGAVASILLDTVEEVAPELFHDDDDEGDGNDDDDSGNDGSGNEVNAEKHEAEAEA
jgi:hypothetical protein